MRSLTSWMMGAFLLGGAALVATPSPAAACGGFFCNNFGIDQSGEDILFVFNDDGTVTTVVQIAYEGPSEDFAWILPVPQEPQVSVGVNAMFAMLEQTTAPQFFLDRSETVGNCRAYPDCFLAFDRTNVASPGGAETDDGDGDPSNGVEVLQQDSVGPYDFAVIRSGSADALRTWLTDNDYIIPELAAAELDHYVELDHYFVALRLTKGSDAGEIAPIVLRSENDQPCIPIRLTRIATVPNMPVKAYFLAESRVRPLNYLLVEADLNDPDLWRGALDGNVREAYAEMVSRVADDAGGHAFVTDFAGPSPQLWLDVGSIDHLRTETDPGAFLEGLRRVGLRGDSQLLALFQRYLPPPPDVEAQAFYNCISNSWCDTYDSYVAAIVFDPEEFADALEEAVLAPRREAHEWFQRGDHLTRLFTTLSADEMDIDPEFVVSAELEPDVPRSHAAAQRIECSPQYFEFAAPRTVVLPNGDEFLWREGVEYPGTDRQFCEDVFGTRMFAPERTEAELRATAELRRIQPAGGALCTVTAVGARTPGMAFLLPFLVVFGGLLARRRARS